MWMQRRMFQTSWAQKLKNIEVLKREKFNQQLLQGIKCIKIESFGHIIKNSVYNLLQFLAQ